MLRSLIIEPIAMQANQDRNSETKQVSSVSGRLADLSRVSSIVKSIEIS